MNKYFGKQCFFAEILVVAFLIMLSSVSAHAQMSHKEMLQKSDEARGNMEGIEWEITMDSVENGRDQHRKLRVIAKGYNSLVDTLAPGNVRGQKLLMQDRNMWFAKPGLSKAVPISPRQKLMGTAANGDIASTNYAGDYKIVNAEEGRFNDESCIVMNLKAVDSRATYDRVRYWISSDRLLGLKAEFYTISGKMFKTAVFEYKNSIIVDDKPRDFISKMIIHSAVIKDDVTTVSYSKPLIKKVSDATFNLNLLTR